MLSPSLKIPLLAAAMMPWLIWTTPVAAQSTPPQYTISELPIGDASSVWEITDINNLGQVSGSLTYPDLSPHPRIVRAVVWSDSQLQELGAGGSEGEFVPGCEAHDVSGQSAGNAISDRGTVVGYADFDFYCSLAGGNVPFFGIRDAVVFPLRTSSLDGTYPLPNAGEIINKFPYAINNNGQIVGQSPTGG